MNASSDTLKILDDAQLAAEREERKLAKLEAQRLRKQKVAEQKAAAEALNIRQNLVPEKMTVVTLAEAKELIEPETPIELPVELLELENDPVFVAKQTAAELREQAFQANDFRKGMKESLDNLQKEMDKVQHYCAGVKNRWMDEWVKKHPGSGSWINSKEPTSVAHRAMVEKWNDMAIAKVNATYANYLKLKAELVEVNHWLQVHGNDHLVLFQKAEQVCKDAGIDYYQIWPRKEKAHVGA